MLQRSIWFRERMRSGVTDKNQRLKAEVIVVFGGVVA